MSVACQMQYWNRFYVGFREHNILYCMRYIIMTWFVYKQIKIVNKGGGGC